jgi:hypothetical protein
MAVRDGWFVLDGAVFSIDCGAGRNTLRDITGVVRASGLRSRLAVRRAFQQTEELCGANALLPCESDRLRRRHRASLGTGRLEWSGTERRLHGLDVAIPDPRDSRVQRAAHPLKQRV